MGNANGDGVPGKPHGIYLIKFDNSGARVWEKWWGRTDIVGDSHRGSDVIEADDGSYVLTGKIIHSDHMYRLLIMRVDPKGSLLWQKMIAPSLGRGSSIRGVALQQTPDGGFMVAGHNSQNFRSPTSSGSSVFPYILKLDNSGNVLWEKFYHEQNPPSGSLSGKGMYVFTDDKRANLLCTDYYSRDYEVQLARAQKSSFFLAFTIDLNIQYDKRMFRVFRLNESGNVVWEKSLHGEVGLDALFTSISATVDDGVVLTGATRTKNLRAPGEYIVGFLVKFDAAGNQQWKRYFGNSRMETYSESVQQTFDHGYIVSGYTTSGSMLIVKFNGDGKLLWDRVIGQKENFAYCTKQTTGGGYITAGSKYGPRFRLIAVLPFC